MQQKKKHYFIGTSGWNYPQWKQGIYAGCPQKKWLSCYANHFPAIELNSSFYRLPQESYIKRWVELTPEHFRFAVKAWRGITHYARLKDCEDKLTEGLTLFRLFGDKLGPVLFQLPPSLQRDDTLLAQFLSLLPPDMRFVFEFRHASWRHAKIMALLADANIALCYSHMKEWKEPPDFASSLLYIRLHGTEDWFKGTYSTAFLKELASNIQQSSSIKEVYVFFNNTMLGNSASDNAAELYALIFPA